MQSEHNRTSLYLVLLLLAFMLNILVSCSGDDGEVDGGSKTVDKSAELPIEKDDKMIQVLDRMVWYLRIVYSIDFYNGIEYPNEHEMPHRCGIVHARGVVPSKLPTQTECECNNCVQI